MAVAAERFLFLASHLYQVLKGKKPAMEPQRILIVKYDEIGDIICAIPAIEKLIATYPQAQIDVLCKPFAKIILEAIDGVDRVHTTWPSNAKYQWIIDLRSTWKQWLRMVWANPQYYAGRGRVRWRNKGKQVHEIETNMQIMDNLHLIDSTKRWATNENLLLPNEKYVVVHAGARRILRQWPIKNFSLLSQYLFEKYNLHSVYIGAGAHEKTIVDSIVRELPQNSYSQWVDSISINQMAKLVKHAMLFVGNESGPLQIADYWNVKSLSFFGPGVPLVFYPRTSGSQVLHHVLDCNPCNQIDCSQQVPCIDRILIADAMEALDKILDM